jgi:hypothetical protein
MIDLKLSNGTKLDIEYPIELKDKDGNSVYWETSNGDWEKREFTNGKRTYFEDSNRYWAKYEYTNGNCTYWENSNGTKSGTPKSNKKQAILDQIEVLKKQAEAL